MNNENEIMKEFNDTFGEKKETPVEPYRATQNQNLVNPIQNNANNSNVNNNQNFNMVNFVNPSSTMNVVPEVKTAVNNDMPNGQIVSDSSSNNVQQLYDTSNYINDSNKPVVNVKKKATIKINPELRTVILLALVLLIAMFFIPSIFDFLDDLKIKISG